MQQKPRKSWMDSLPFPGHRRAYVVLKLVVLLAAVLLVLYLLGSL